MAALHAEQSRDQRKQRALSGAVEAEQCREAGGTDIEGDVVQRAPCAIGMADAGDRQRRNGGGVALLGRVSLIDDASARYRHGRAIVMPQGSSPTWMVLITF